MTGTVATIKHYKPEVASVPATFVKTLSAAHNGDLWIGYFRGGVSLLRNGRLINYTECDGLPTGAVRKLIQEPDGIIWADGGLARFNGQRWQYISKNWDFPAKLPSSVAVDDTGTVWLAPGTRASFTSERANGNSGRQDSLRFRKDRCACAPRNAG